MNFRTAAIAALMFAATATTAAAATLSVDNKTTSYITVSVDGAYGCNTAGGTTCSIPVSEGAHALKAVRSDNGQTATANVNIGANGYTWTPFAADKPAGQ